MLILSCIVDQHDLRLVAVAALVCVLSAAICVRLLSRNSDRSRGTPRVLLGACALSLGTWTTHFIAMLGFEPNLTMIFYPVLTFASALVILLGVGGGLLLWQAASTAPARLGAGAVTGLAIAAMHYLGVQAVGLPGTLTYDGGMIGLSLLAAAGFGAAALHSLGAPLSVRPLRRQLAGAGLLVLCIVSLHFTGMAAVSISGAAAVPQGLARLWVAVFAGSASLLLVAMLLALTTIEARRRGKRRVREANRLRELAEATLEALVICDLAGRVVDANSQLVALSGMPRDAVLGQAVQLLFQPGDDVLARTGPGVSHLANGVPVETLSRRLGTAEEARIVVALRDMRERVEAENRIRHLAHYDALTGLANRVLMSEKLMAEVARSRRDGNGFAVLYIDLDRFKPVNDVYGHAAGDELLRQVADRLRAELREVDLAARLGGDEFAVIQVGLEESGANRTIALAQRVLEALSVPYDLGGTEVSISCSIGLALYPEDAADADALLRGADIALYRAKEGGRAAFAFFRPEMEQAMRERHVMEQDLRLAIGRGELSLAWQPQAAADTGAVIGFEALLRWCHPVHGNIPPAVFIPIAENSSTIVQVGAWALRAACREAAGWHQPLRIAVNVSPVQVQQLDFPRVVAQTLAETGLEPQRLELEVTESLFVADAERALSVLREIKALGVRVSLDDFGTGYSSLGTLRTFPFDKLKMDRSFVSRLADDEQSAAIVQAILGLSRGMGLPVVAEGVETHTQLDVLRAGLCEEIQGYLIGKPLPIGAYAELTGKVGAAA